MITNLEIWNAFEREYERRSELTLGQKFDLLEGMYDLAVTFGHFRHENVLEGIEVDIEHVKALNATVSRTP